MAVAAPRLFPCVIIFASSKTANRKRACFDRFILKIHRIRNKTATIIAATNSTIGPFAQSAQATAPQALQQWSLPPASNLTTISPQEAQPQPPQQPMPNGSSYDDIKPSFAKIAKFDFGPSGSFYDDDATDELNGSDEINKSISTSSANMVSNSRDPMQPRQRRKVPEGELCAVCSDRATGYHYGVASCNGCKTFFRRTIVSEHTFVCQYSGNCDVTKNVRCACRHCRFNKCVSVGMDARAIQNDRDRIGPTKKFRMAKRNSSGDEDQFDRQSLQSLSPLMHSNGSVKVDDKLVEQLMGTEQLCNKLRNCILDECRNVRETLVQPSLLYQVNNLQRDDNTEFKELYPASMNDIQMWNIRELRLCLEWAKTFEEFQRLSDSDQFYLVRNFAFTFNILNRVYYSLDHGPDKIVYPNGAYILRQPQEQVRIPGCRSIYHRQMDEIMIPFRKLNVSIDEFAAFKAALLFNPDACDLSPEVREEINQERTKYLTLLFYLITQRNSQNTMVAVQKYGQLLMMAPSIQNIIDQNDENMHVMEVFGHFWRINGFVKELCMK
ncbi:ligand-binding domain of nuclear hormone receptor domain-containing protein [Ditylenchus destructor]|nr:ligand-binding domain of nuclear hormone receptor domain-containing protein [Ditylenchus destructor]